MYKFNKDFGNVSSGISGYPTIILFQFISYIIIIFELKKKIQFILLNWLIVFSFKTTFLKKPKHYTHKDPKILPTPLLQWLHLKPDNQMYWCS